MAYQKILLALEGKEEEKKVIKEAMRLKKEFKAELTVFHVNDVGAGKVHATMVEVPLHKEEDVRGWISDAGFKKEAEQVKITIKESGHSAEEIAKATKPADLLIIGHHHKNRFLAAIIDSVDEHVADLVCCPVLLVPMR
jgi:nucleotide-binding universal stress UspA family protein